MKCYHVFSIACCLRKWKSWQEGVTEVGNPGRRGGIAVWEIQLERGGLKHSCHLSGVCVFFLE